MRLVLSIATVLIIAQALNPGSNPRRSTDSHVTSDTVRVTVEAHDLDALLEKLRQQGARLVSVTPLRGTLEDYFLARTSDEETVKL